MFLVRYAEAVGQLDDIYVHGTQPSINDVLGIDVTVLERVPDLEQDLDSQIQRPPGWKTEKYLRFDSKHHQMTTSREQVLILIDVINTSGSEFLNYGRFLLELLITT